MKIKKVSGIALAILLVTAFMIARAFILQPGASTARILAGNPVTQVFQAMITWNLPSEYIGPRGIVTVDFVSLLNRMPAVVFNDALAKALTIAEFSKQGFQVQAISITNSHWIDNNGKAAIVFNLQITSGPITAADIAAIILGLAAILTAIFIAISYPTVFFGALVLTALVLAGVFVISSVLVAPTSSNGEPETNFCLITRTTS